MRLLGRRLVREPILREHRKRYKFYQLIGSFTVGETQYTTLTLSGGASSGTAILTGSNGTLSGEYNSGTVSAQALARTTFTGNYTFVFGSITCYATITSSSSGAYSLTLYSNVGLTVQIGTGFYGSNASASASDADVDAWIAECEAFLTETKAYIGSDEYKNLSSEQKSEKQTEQRDKYLTLGLKAIQFAGSGSPSLKASNYLSSFCFEFGYEVTTNW